MKVGCGLPVTSRACYRAGIHCSSSLEPLPNKDIKVKVNKQKFSDERPAETKAQQR